MNIATLILLGYSAYASAINNINLINSKVGDSIVSNTILIEVLDSINPQLLEEQILKEAVSTNLPMQRIEGIAIKAHSPINIIQYDSAPLLVLIGLDEKSLSTTPLSENALIRWKNINANQYNETPLFDTIKNKIPPAQIPQPVAAVTASHHYTIEILNLRSKLNLQWKASKYNIQVVNGDWVSNIIELQLLTRDE